MSHSKPKKPKTGSGGAHSKSSKGLAQKSKEKRALMRTGGNFAQLGVAGGEERKYVDTDIGITLATAASFVLLNALVPGSQATQRVGRKADFVSMLLRMRVVVGGTPTNATYRIMVIVDKQANAVAPTIAEIMSAASLTNPMNLDNRSRFVVLLDYVDTLDIAGNSQNVRTVFMRKKISTTYNSGSAGTIGDIQTNSIYLLGLSSNAAGATAPILSGTGRLRFTDS